LSGKASAPAKNKAAKKRSKANPATIEKMKAAAKKRWGAKKKKQATSHFCTPIVS